jgi:pyrrolidone-carboxylate peptidase
MKAALPLLLLPSFLWARSVVLVSYFDPFVGAAFNNSERIAAELSGTYLNHPEIDLRLCALPTVFDKSIIHLEECYKKLETEPKLVLGLGESDCNLKAEIMGRNRDHTYYPDNEGNEKNNSPIMRGLSSAIIFPISSVTNTLRLCLDLSMFPPITAEDYKSREDPFKRCWKS